MSMGSIKLEGVLLYPAQTDGKLDVYGDNGFVLSKARWIADNEVSHCPICQQKFGQIKRKHHCRQCGRVYCSKCCKANVPLPQLGSSEPERVCDDCLTVVEFVTKARSNNSSFQLEAAKGIVEQIHNTVGLRKVAELGGVQTLIMLSSRTSTEVKKACAEGIHLLSMHEPLHSLLLDSGVVKALCGLINSSSESDEQLLSDVISSLMIFAKEHKHKMKVVSDGALPPVLALCGMKVSEAIALVALRTLNLLTENVGSHAAIIENDRNALPRLLALTLSEDEQMQELSLKTLGRLSTGTDFHRHRIVQEDFSAGKCLVKSLQRRPKNLQVLCNAACLVANLATSEQDQSSLAECLDAMCTLMSNFNHNTDMLTHVTRGLANFAKFQQNTYRLEQHLPNIVNITLKSADTTIQTHSLRLVLSILLRSPDSASSILLRDGAAPLLQLIAKTSGLVDSMQMTLQQKVQELSPPS